MSGKDSFLLLRCLDVDPPRSRAIKLAEKDFLPGPQNQTAVFNNHCNRAADNRRFDMAVGVSFHVTIPVVRGNQLIQLPNNISTDSD